jgi:hypothetical protein
VLLHRATTSTMSNNRKSRVTRKGARKQSGRKGVPPEDKAVVARDEDPLMLEPIQDQLAIGIVLRFVATNNFGGNFAVTFANLLDAWFVAGTATVAYQLFDFVRIKKIVIRSMGVAKPYAVGVAQPAPPMATVGVEFYGLNLGNLGNGKQKSDSQLGYDTPAFVSLKPDPTSQVAQWQPSSTNSAFAIRAVDQDSNALAGTIVDVHLVYRNSADVNPAAVGTARAGMQPGDLYFGGLDGLALANTQMRSVFVRRA